MNIGPSFGFAWIAAFLGGSLISAIADETAPCTMSGELIKPVTATHTLVPYPTISQRTGEQGTTSLLVNVGTDGAATNVAVTRSSGSSRLDDAAATYIKAHYRWEPPLKDCKDASVQMPIIVAWHLGAPPKPDVALNMPERDFPPGAADYMESGDTYLELTLGDGGVVKDGRVIYSSGYTDLDDQALRIMKLVNVVMPKGRVGTAIVVTRWIPPKKAREILNIYAQRFP